jgi:hypothetical protein
VRGWAAWSPGAAPVGAAPPALLRRRVSPLGQEALRAVWSLPETQTSRIIASSRHGEFGRTLSILDTLVGDAEVSPADFTLSVHHALVGLLSIACGNRQGHTAVAAGSESFCFGFLEALSCLSERPDEPVVLVHYDEPLPEPFAVFDRPAGHPEVLALVLAAAAEGAPLSLATAPAGKNLSRSHSHAMDFLTFLQNPDLTEGVSPGERLDWHWRRHATAA